MDLVSETKELKDDVQNNQELPQEVSKDIQPNRHNAQKNAHGVLNDVRLQQIQDTIPHSPHLMPFKKVMVTMRGVPYEETERPTVRSACHEML
jgi:hypothetical protein